jgi:hypothetical protein
MAVTANSIIQPQGPAIYNLSLAAVTACATRAPTATASLAGSNIFLLVPTSTNGIRVDKILAKGCSTSITAATVAQTITIWEWDGVTAFPIDELLVTAVTPSTTVASYQGQTNYTNFVLPATHALYASTSVTTTAATTALCLSALGAVY